MDYARERGLDGQGRENLEKWDKVRSIFEDRMRLGASEHAPSGDRSKSK